MITELVFSIAIAWFFGKVLKTIIEWVEEKKISLKVLFYEGGMPSLHTALVVSLATGLFLETGFSYWFVIGIILALIVINDAFNVRWVTQEQSRVLNKLVTEGKKLNEHVGHKPVEVFVGLVIGIVVPVIVYGIL